MIFFINELKFFYTEIFPYNLKITSLGLYIMHLKLYKLKNENTNELVCVAHRI